MRLCRFVGATVQDTAGEFVVDAPQVMHNLTIARVATYVVGAGQWVVHNAYCPISPNDPNVLGREWQWAESYIIRSNDGRPIAVDLDNLTGTPQDIVRANQEAANRGLYLGNLNLVGHSPLGVWHHVEDGATLQFVLERIHGIGHIGGEAVIRTMR